MTTPKKAPTASECLRLIRFNLVGSGALEEGSPIHKHVNVEIDALLEDVERAEAEAAQEPGDSVEARGDTMASTLAEYADRAGRLPVYIHCDADHLWCVKWSGGRTACFLNARGAVTAAINALKPATPDASWLDTATFEEMEAWLPDDWTLEREDSQLGRLRIVSRFGAGDWHVTASDAVRAYLQANPELWSNR